MRLIQRDFHPLNSVVHKLSFSHIKRAGMLMFLGALLFIWAGCASVSRNGGHPAGQGDAWWESDSPNYNRKYSW